MSIQQGSAGGVPVLILKEGTSQTKGRDAQKNNITAAKLIAEISKATDNEVGDGTTSVVVLAGALIEKAEDLINKGVHPTVIVDGYRKAATKAIEVLNGIAQKVAGNEKQELIRIAKTAMQTKLVSKESDELAQIVVDAALAVSEKTDSGFRLDIEDVKVEKKAGGSIRDTKLVKGIVLDKEIVHGGMPKRIEKAKIALINSALEIEKTEFDAKININSPDQMKMFLEEENRMLKSMVDKIIESGANVVVCQKGIDDIAQHYLAKANVLTVRRV